MPELSDVYLFAPLSLVATIGVGDTAPDAGDGTAARGRGPARAQGRGSPGGWWLVAVVELVLMIAL